MTNKETIILEKAAQKLDQMNVTAKYMTMLTSSSPLLKSTAIKAVSKLASHGRQPLSPQLIFQSPILFEIVDNFNSQNNFMND